MTATYEMKDSGVQWIGEIPKAWKTGKVKNAFFHTKEIVGTRVDDFERLALTLQGVIKRSKEDSEGLQPQQFEGYQILRQNELVFKLIDLQNVQTSRVGWCPFAAGIVSPAYIVLHHRNNDSTRYAYYFFLSMWLNQIFNTLADDSVRSCIGQSDLLNLPYLLPPLSEQTAIASYLDDKCGRIDDVVAQAKATIEEYRKWKASLIFETVTKGLDKNAEMKDSGVEWIGMVPKGWNLKRGKNILRLLNRPINDSDEIVTCFRDGEVTLRKNRREEGFTNALLECGYQGVEPGDLVVHGMDGFAGSIGISDSRGKASPVLNVLACTEHKRFIMYYLRALALRDVFMALSTGIRVRSCDLRWNKLANLPYLLPPLSEQAAIASYLDTKCSAIDGIIAEKESLIAELEAYKKSLIFETVTGKRRVC